MRMRPSIIALLAVALLAQASLPLIHAQNWARTQNDSGLSYAFCGKVSPLLLAKMKAVSPPELYGQSTASATAQDCRLCLVVSALGAMLGSLAVVLLLAGFAGTPQSVTRPGSVFAVAVRGFDARAPPRLFLL